MFYLVVHLIVLRNTLAMGSLPYQPARDRRVRDSVSVTVYCRYSPFTEALPMTFLPTSYYRHPRPAVIRYLRVAVVMSYELGGESSAKFLRTGIRYLYLFAKQEKE